MARPILGLAVKPPWAGLIVAGVKTIEVRTWWPRLQLPALVAIHASKTIDAHAPAEVINRAEEIRSDWRQKAGMILGAAVFMERIDFGGKHAYTNPVKAEILCHARWVNLAAQHLNPIEWWSRDLVGFRFDQGQRFRDIIPCRGLPGFFRLEPEIEARVREAMGDA